MADGTYLDDPDFTLYEGDALETLRTLPDESVHCVVTSPPYWGLRDYGTGTWEGSDADCDHSTGKLARNDNESLSSYEVPRGAGGVMIPVGGQTIRGGEVLYRGVCGKCGARRVDQQLGLEPTPDAYVANMVELFREVRRVLRRDGTCWLNLGDSYASGEVGRVDAPAKNVGLAETQKPRAERRIKQATGLKPKDLVGIPWRVAFALQADGWYLRSDIIWSKPNPMPESVTDRPTKAHEYLFLLTRSARYFYDADAIREPHTDSNESRFAAIQRHGTATGPEVTQRNSPHAMRNDSRGLHGVGTSFGAFNPSGRNARSVWEIATQPYPEAHFATFPEELARRCIAAGTSERGCCPECGAPWGRETDRDPNPDGIMGRGNGRHLHDFNAAARGKHLDVIPPRTVAWRPSCDHAQSPIPCVVLDPFMGSGTVAHVARKLGRRSIGIELNPDYCELAARRMQQLSLLA